MNNKLVDTSISLEGFGYFLNNFYQSVNEWTWQWSDILFIAPKQWQFLRALVKPQMLGNIPLQV
jgi:hypothetical protein